MKNNQFPRMHVSLYVSNLAATVNFYNSFFGQQPDKIKPGYTKYILEKPSLIISFVENQERVKANFGHLGFQIDTLEELNERLAVAKQKQLRRNGNELLLCRSRQILGKRSRWRTMGSILFPC